MRIYRPSVYGTYEIGSSEFKRARKEERKTLKRCVRVKQQSIGRKLTTEEYVEFREYVCRTAQFKTIRWQ